MAEFGPPGGLTLISTCADIVAFIHGAKQGEPDDLTDEDTAERRTAETRAIGYLPGSIRVRCNPRACGAHLKGER